MIKSHTSGIPKERFLIIDLLRGFAMLIVILTHTAAYYYSDKTIYAFWNIIHFAVPTLIFCSGYVLFQKYHSINSLSQYILFLKKRIIRLVKPFYIFLVFLFILQLIQHRFHISQLWEGVRILYPDISWLVLLFIQLTILFPLCLYVIKRHILLWASLILMGGLGIVLIFWRPSIDYRWYMGIPWLLPFVISYFYMKIIEKKMMYKILLTTFFLTLFLLQFIYLKSINHDLILQNNKYPPNLYYLSYGLSWLFGLTIIFDNSWIRKILSKPLSFFSMNSFTLYFIHFLLIETFANQPLIHFNFWTFSASVLAGSVIVQVGLNLFLLNIKERKLVLGNR